MGENQRNPTYDLQYQRIVGAKTILGVRILHYKQREIECIIDQIKQQGNSGTILDVGCSTGFFTRRLADCFGVERVNGADVCFRSVERCRERYPEIRFHHIRKGFYGNHASRFDYVLLSHVLEHVDMPIQFLYKIKGLMKSNASLIMCIPQERIRGDAAFPENLFNILRLRFGNVHRVKYSFQDLSDLLKETGLTITNHQYINAFSRNHNRESFFNHSLVACTRRVG